VPSFVSILKQVIDERLPQDYNHQGVPAPWIQMTLLRLLATLGANDKQYALRSFAQSELR